jgi:hypothetical protein
MSDIKSPPQHGFPKARIFFFPALARGQVAGQPQPRDFGKALKPQKLMTLDIKSDIFAGNSKKRASEALFVRSPLF